MTLALFGTAYFPPVAYMAALARCAEAAIECKETFPKQTYRNRMVIVTAGGVRTLTVPVVRTNHSRTDEVTVDYRQRWNVLHLRTLTAAYAASPYFLYYKDDVEALLMARYSRLIDLNQAVLQWLIDKLKIDCRFSFTDDYRPFTDGADDFRQRFSPKVPYDTSAWEPYYQVFEDRQPFVPNLSVFDLLMNLGPEAREYLMRI
ncbi:MAG: WbqC family protein [Bacteroidales bacterium]|nr:WbqC family protein [Bacteroidales bacterium]